MTQNVTNITIGIKYIRSFRIQNIHGEIIDSIIRAENTPFKSSEYRIVFDTNNEGKILSNEDGSKSISIDRDNIVIKFDTNTPKETFNQLQKKIIPFITDKIFKKYKIEGINRIGVIFTHKISKLKEVEQITSKITNQKVVDPNSLLIRFSKKSLDLKGKATSEKNDYKNTIYTFEKTKDGIIADVDRQKYFEPALKDMRDAGLNDFFLETKAYLKQYIYPWLKDESNHAKE